MKTFKQFYETISGAGEPLPDYLDMGDVTSDNYSDAKGLPKLTKQQKKFWANYINELELWLDGDETNYKFMLKNRNKIPKKYRSGGFLYRGLHFGDIEGAWDAIKSDKLGTIADVESWTRDPEEAKFFAEKGDYGFVVGTKIPDKDVVVDVPKFVLDWDMVKVAAKVKDDYMVMGVGYAEQESEVIVSGKRAAILLNDKSVSFSSYMGTEVDDYYLFHGLIEDNK